MLRTCVTSALQWSSPAANQSHQGPDWASFHGRLLALSSAPPLGIRNHQLNKAIGCVTVLNARWAMRAWRLAGRWTSQLEALSRRKFTLSSSIQKDQGIADILRHGKNEDNLSVNGWVKSIRKQKRIAFAAVGDGSTTQSLQAVLKPEDAAKYVCETNCIAIY